MCESKLQKYLEMLITVYFLFCIFLIGSGTVNTKIKYCIKYTRHISLITAWKNSSLSVLTSKDEVIKQQSSSCAFVDSLLMTVLSVASLS